MMLKALSRVIVEDVCFQSFRILCVDSIRPRPETSRKVRRATIPASGVGREAIVPDTSASPSPWLEASIFPACF